MLNASADDRELHGERGGRRDAHFGGQRRLGSGNGGVARP